MRRFFTKLMMFSIFVLLSMFVIFTIADGSTDAMYLKFTTPQQDALVLGGSRAAQGLQPSQLNLVLNRWDIYNYAFQNPNSPYGDIYFESIKRKLNNNVKNGVFILEVNPWNMIWENTNKSLKNLTETDNFIANTHYVTLNPNLEYLTESFNSRVVDILENRLTKGQNKTYLIEADGWLHLTIEPDSIGNFSRRKQKINTYTEKLEKEQEFSEYRGESLSKLIQFLKAHGEVYLVRMPVRPEMLMLEDKLLPNFNNIIENISKENQVIYINKMSSNYKYSFVDGHHLDVRSGREFSIELAESIKNKGN